MKSFIPNRQKYKCPEEIDHHHRFARLAHRAIAQPPTVMQSLLIKPPGGNVTLLFTDIEHSTQLWEKNLARWAVPLAATLLRRCPKMTILASSHEALNIEGETLLSVPPLGVPEFRREFKPGEIAGMEAVQLFVERASAVPPVLRSPPRTPVDRQNLLAAGRNSAGHRTGRRPHQGAFIGPDFHRTG